jgi:CheY-like chemotaxis protein
MNLNGNIVIIEDDLEDREILEEVFSIVIEKNNYDNKIVMFDNGEDAIKFLRDTEDSPFLIVSDINMPKYDGFQVRQVIFDDQKLRDKCVPYIFLTTSGDNSDFMRKAYALSIQGYFTKPNDYREYEQLITDIVRYWKIAKIANRI